jgi:hypothetical protein
VFFSLGSVWSQFSILGKSRLLAELKGKLRLRDWLGTHSQFLEEHGSLVPWPEISPLLFNAEDSWYMCLPLAPDRYPAESPHNSVPAQATSSSPAPVQALGGLSGSMVTLDKLLDPMDSMISQPVCCLQTPALLKASCSLEISSSLEISGVIPFPDCLQVQKSSAGCWQVFLEPCKPSPLDLPPRPDDNCTLPAAPSRGVGLGPTEDSVTCLTIHSQGAVQIPDIAGSSS